MSAPLDLLLEGADAPFLIAPSGNWNCREAREQALAWAAALAADPAGRIACQLPDGPELVLLMLAASASGKELLLLSQDYSEDYLAELAVQFEVDLLLSERSPALPTSCRSLQFAHWCEGLSVDTLVARPAQGDILILTSGTTGKPKCARYHWPDLLAQVGSRHAASDERWLLAYRLNHFAGLQMLAHILVSHAALVLPESTAVSAAIEAIGRFRVTHVSSTPTFWRFALAALAAHEATPPLEHITLGSEPVSAELLDELAGRFPAARIVHIYALTEAGSCISVSDGRPGLPADILERPLDAAVRFRIQDGELQVKSAHGMAEYVNGSQTARTEDGWLATGDLVQQEDDRIFFQGRRSETINVGGVKVQPLEVEHVVNAVPGVELARVFGRDNPIMGQIVAVEMMLEAGFDAAAVEDAVREACMVLPRHGRPRSIDIVDSIETRNLKVVRRGT